ncbi:hypothetical protein AA313_de0205753 [Arthrobotrys entomopaga]|nr:hypothetical protein AA313_de0205753 [Arthrobotrys entomopaga]
MLSIRILTVVFAFLLNLFYRAYKHRTRFRGLPQPPHHPILGHLKVLGEAAALLPPNTHPQAYLTIIAQKYNLPDIYYLDLWPVTVSQVVLSNPDLMGQVTVTRDLPKHTAGDDFLAPVVGRNSIATSNGAVWKRTHAAMSPAFSWSHIRNLSGLILDETLLFRSTLDKLSATNEVFSFEIVTAKLVFDVIGRMVFNFPLHAQTLGSAYLEDVREMMHLAEAGLSWSPLVKLRAWWRGGLFSTVSIPKSRARLRNASTC